MSHREAQEVVTVTETVLRDWALPAPGSDKKSRGTVLVVGGSAESPGAVLLSGEAALRAGGGKLQMATARQPAAHLALLAPESRTLALPDEDGVLGAAAAERTAAAAESADVVLLGPGMSDIGATVGLLEGVVPRLDVPCVVDALASAFVTEHPDGLGHLGGRWVLTVNPTELARVLGRGDDEVTRDQQRAALECARRTGAVVLCGGTSKTVAAPDGRLWSVEAGGPGLGVSGSGDVQSGLVAGLLARGVDPDQAAVWGGFLHAAAGDRLAARTGPVGFLARELSAEVPALMAALAG